MVLKVINGHKINYGIYDDLWNRWSYMVCINNCSTRRTSAPPIVTSAPDIMWGTDGVRVFTADDGWVWTFAAVDHWHAECVGWHPAARGGARAAPARASPATPASGQPGCRRGSAVARGSCDGPHPGTVSGPGQCEWPPVTAHPTVRASARGAPGPHPALGAAHEPAARRAPSATVPTGSTPVVFFNEKRTDNEERSTQRNRPLNRIMANASPLECSGGFTTGCSATMATRQCRACRCRPLAGGGWYGKITGRVLRAKRGAKGLQRKATVEA